MQENVALPKSLAGQYLVEKHPEELFSLAKFKFNETVKIYLKVKKVPLRE